MSEDEDLFMNGSTTRIKSIYQQASTGEKHVLFYPTSTPTPTSSIEDRKSRQDEDTKIPNQASATLKDAVRMKTDEAQINIPPAPQSVAPSHGGESEKGGGGGIRIGVYGWRKKCLYILILLLLVMVIVNLALTLWVLKVMEFSSEGMGQLKIVTGGVRLDGKAFVLDRLIASSIKSRSYQPIVIESTKNLTLKSRNKEGYLSSRLVLENDRLECLTNNFKILDDRGSLLFSANRKEVLVGSETLHVTGEGGTILRGSIQTRLVRAEAGHDLRLESPTRSLEMKGAKGVHLESRGGGIGAVAFNDISFKSEVGALRLDTASILMPALPTAKLTTPGHLKYSNPSPAGLAATQATPDIYQLCVCESGKLFLASPHLVCASENDDRVCR